MKKILRISYQVEISSVSKNSKLLVNNIPYNVDEVNFVKPGKGRAIYRLKLRNLMGGGVLDVTYHSGEKVEEANISVRDMQFLYKENENYIFMDTETFEQYLLAEDRVGDRHYYLKDGLEVTILLHEEMPIDVTLPNNVELTVTKSDITSKTDTVTAQSINAELETGLTISVPAFIKEGDVIRVDTRTGAYLERVG
jgi:elongation factor P